jgi:hypothetical protein
MKQMELDLPGSVELSDQEKMEIQGGGWLTPVFWSIAASFMSNFQDVREGFSDGIAGKAPRY